MASGFKKPKKALPRSSHAETKMDDGLDENELTLVAIILAGFTLHLLSQLLGVFWKHTTTALYDRHPISYRCSLVANSVVLSACLLVILLRIIRWLRFKPGTFLWEMRLLVFVALTACVLVFVSAPLFYG